MGKRKLPERWRNAIVRYADEDPASLLANPQNWRVHPREQTAALNGSLTELGWIAPVIVNETTQHVVDGHARIGEAIARGEASVPVAYVRLTEAQERLALATFDPITAMALTDQEMLDGLLAGLSSDQDGLSDLLASLAAEQPKHLNDDDADLTPPADPITRTGDLWLLGDHRLLCGDSTVAADVEWLMGGQVADAVITDPPFKLSQQYSAGTDSDNLTAVTSVWPVAAQLMAFSKPGALAAVVYDNRILPYGLDLFRRSGWKYLRALTLYRRWGAASLMLGWMSTSDLVLIFAKPGAPFRFLNDSPFHDVYVKDGPEDEDANHPSQKPLAFIAKIISTICPPAGVVLDAWSGSGTTLIAAERTERVAHLMEIEPAYVDVAVRRWEHLTGKKAVRDRARIPSLVSA